MSAKVPLDADAPRSLRLLHVDPLDGSVTQPLLNIRFEFDRQLDPASIGGAVTLEHPDPGVTFLADPFRNVNIRMEGGGRILVIETPEMLVGREVRVRITDTLRGVDGSRASADMPTTFSYRVMELPP